MIVLEDVDLDAQERTFGPFGSNPALFELMGPRRPTSDFQTDRDGRAYPVA